MNFMSKIIYFSLFIFSQINIISLAHPQLNFKDKYDKLLNKNFKSDIELIFDPSFDFDNITKSDESIRKYYRKYKESELNLVNGARLKCFTPSKIKKNITRSKVVLENRISDDLAQILLRESSEICYNSNFKDWFYKLCPFRSATQVLGYKKRNDKTGEEYTESWNLGFRNTENLTDFDPIEFYQNKTNDTTSVNLEKNPFVIVEDRIAKIYNYDLSSFKKFELGLIVEYDLEELRQLDKPVIVNKYIKSVEDYLRVHPDVTKIPIQRKILRLVNKHLVILDGSFPIPKSIYNVNVNLIKQREFNEIITPFTLTVYGDYVYCNKCEFLTHYSVGDSFFIVRF